LAAAVVTARRADHQAPRRDHVTSDHLLDASKLWPCWPMADAVIRERNRGWSGVGPPWTYLCSDIERDRPAADHHARLAAGTEQ